MKKLLLISILLSLFIFTGCTSNKELVQLKEENASLKAQLWTEEIKPDVVKATISRIWWGLSRQTSMVWDMVYGIETMPINEETLKNIIWYYFNSAWDTLIASCGNWYKMTKCTRYSNDDNVTNNDNEMCRLLNEDPNLMRTSMIIECAKM